MGELDGGLNATGELLGYGWTLVRESNRTRRAAVHEEEGGAQHQRHEGQRYKQNNQVCPANSTTTTLIGTSSAKQPQHDWPRSAQHTNNDGQNACELITTPACTAAARLALLRNPPSVPESCQPKKWDLGAPLATGRMHLSTIMAGASSIRARSSGWAPCEVHA